MRREQGLTLPAAAIAVAGFFAAVVLPRATWPLIDGDVWWHLRAGREILASGAIPTVDTWSILGEGRPWTSQDWLSNVFMAAVYGDGGWGATALSGAYGLLTVGAFGVLWNAISVRAPGVGWAARSGWLVAGLLVAGPVLGARVQVVDLVFAALTLNLAWRHLASGQRRWLAALPVVAAAWANLHAGWPLLFLLGGAVLVGEVLDGRRHRLLEPGALAVAQVRDLGLALVASFAALAVNPSGVQLWRYPLDTLGIGALSRYIFEWFPISGDLRLAALLGGFTALSVAPALLWGGHRLRSADALMLVGLTVMAVVAMRFLLTTGPLVAAISCVVLAPHLSATSLGRRASASLLRLSTPRTGVQGVVHLGLAAAVVVLGVGLAVGRVTPAAQEAAIAEHFPVAAVEWMAGYLATDPRFNMYEWGGYLGFAHPDGPVFVDGRADIYGEQRLEEYAAVISLAADPEAYLEGYNITVVLFAPGTPLARWLDASPHWERLFADAVASVWVTTDRERRRGPPPVE